MFMPFSSVAIVDSEQVNPANNYMFKVNNRNTRRRCEVFSKLTIKILERRQWLGLVNIRVVL